MTLTPSELVQQAQESGFIQRQSQPFYDADTCMAVFQNAVELVGTLDPEVSQQLACYGMDQVMMLDELGEDATDPDVEAIHAWQAQAVMLAGCVEVLRGIINYYAAQRGVVADGVEPTLN
jgi:hypothetical protein